MIQRLDAHEDQRGWEMLSDREGTLAFDVGANIGQAAKVMAQHFKQVVSFEPCEESYAILHAEMPKNVVCVPYAVSDAEGDIQLYEADYSITTGQLVSHENGLQWGATVGLRIVHAMTLDSAVFLFGTPDFLKVDTEGHEVEVIRGGGQLFNDCPPRLLVEVHHENNEKPIRDLLPMYNLEKLEHGPYVRPGSMVHKNHFWLRGEPSV